RLPLRTSYVENLVTGRESKFGSLFEFYAAPGFDTGAHYHTRIEEYFYILEGELDLRLGDREFRAGPGTLVFVCPPTPHYIANRGTKPGRLLLGCSPPGHENYFSELSALLAIPGPPDSTAIAKLREKYDTIQISALQSK
ncbi:MAG TPA: cupin domain-containing protein, partial [Candidatus Baltobacteraceae bacterium]|nr:cupin domain-containing protein [Candidatus Baltobacteraceae bacterium]